VVQAVEIIGITPEHLVVLELLIRVMPVVQGLRLLKGQAVAVALAKQEILMRNPMAAMVWRFQLQVLQFFMPVAVVAQKMKTLLIRSAVKAAVVMVPLRQVERIRLVVLELLIPEAVVVVRVALLYQARAVQVLSSFVTHASIQSEAERDSLLAHQPMVLSK
jgi:hypothetical protein